MRNRFIIVSGVALLASAMAQVSLAQTPLPANIQADRAAIQQDATNLKAVFEQLRADEQAGNASAVAADRTAARLARIQLHEDFAKLHQDAQVILQPAQAASVAALTQLHADQIADNAAAVQADQTAVDSAQMQLKSERTAVFGDLGIGFGGHHRHKHD
jgi:hypothetical protein